MSDKSDLSGLLRKELLEKAKKLGLTGISRLKKAQLVEVIRAALPEPKPKKKAATKKKAAPKKAAAPKKKAAPKKAAAPKKKAAPKKAAPKKKAARPKKAAPRPSFSREELQDLDSSAHELPELGSENRIVLLPRDPSWLFTYWELTREYKEAARRAGGEVLSLRLYDLTGVTGKNANATYQHEVSEWARSWYLPVPAPEREFAVELGYAAGDQWFPLVRSNTVVVPAEQPSAWIAQQYATISPGDALPVAGEAPGAADTDAPGGAAAPAVADTMAQVLVEDGDLRIVLETRPPVTAGSLGTSADLAGAPGSMGHLPGSMGQVPGSMGHLPGSLGQIPGSLGHQPGSLGHLPGSLGFLPAGASAATPVVLEAANGEGGPGMSNMPGGVAAAFGQPAAGQPLLEAAVEVVIAGRSFPGTALSVAGRPIPVGPDGAFSLRISVPDGTREIPIEAAEEATGRRRRICLQLGRAVD